MSKVALTEAEQAVEDGVQEALKAAGYTWETEEGEDLFDTTAFARGAFEVVKDVRVSSKEEKAAKALQRAALVRRMFPDFVGPWAAEWDLDDETLPKVYDRLDRKVWNEANPARSARLQKRVMREVGMVLCRTRVPTTDGQLTDAVYITDAIELIRADFARPLRHGAERAAEKLASNVAAVIEVLPKHRKVLEKEVSNGMKAASDLARTRLQLEAGSPDEE